MAKPPTKPAHGTTAPFTIQVGQGAIPVDEGAYNAQVAAVFDLGIQPPPAGIKGAPRRRIAIGFELIGTTSASVEPEVPPIMYRWYSQSWGPKAELPKFVRAVLGRDPQPGERLTPGEWLGKPVAVTIEHVTRADGSTSARIASVTRCTAKGLPALAATPRLYPGGLLAELPEWAQAAIAGALTAVSPVEATGYAKGADDVPQ